MQRYNRATFDRTRGSCAWCMDDPPPSREHGFGHVGIYDQPLPWSPIVGRVDGFLARRLLESSRGPCSPRRRSPFLTRAHRTPGGLSYVPHPSVGDGSAGVPGLSTGWCLATLTSRTTSYLGPRPQVPHGVRTSCPPAQVVFPEGSRAVVRQGPPREPRCVRAEVPKRCATNGGTTCRDPRRLRP